MFDEEKISTSLEEIYQVASVKNDFEHLIFLSPRVVATSVHTTCLDKAIF